MQEPYKKGVANRLGPESCADVGDNVGEALTGAHAGQPWSSEITSPGVPTLYGEGEGHIRDGVRREPPRNATESETLCMRGNSLHGNRETLKASAASNAPPADGGAERSEKAYGRTSGMHAFGESDGSIVPKKQANKADLSAAEPVEGRGPAQGNNLPAGHVPDTEPGERGRGLQGVREAAKRDQKMRFTALLHHVTVDLLRVSYFELKRSAAPGVDGVTWQAYGDGLEERLADLHGRVHRGVYRAQPSKRAWIPKADGRQRPLGIAALEDKIVQQAVKTVLETIYEEDFLGFSYGFRPGRSCHNALDALWVGILRLLRKWLQAGVSEDGQWSETTVGIPQGAVISPLLANVFLHYVLDQWVQQWRSRHAHGDMIFVRYADDFVLGFQHRGDAERFRQELRERLAKFGLELHPDKTRLIEFDRFAAQRRVERDAGKPETFDFLGFTHCCGKTRQGAFTIKRVSVAKRMRAKLQTIKEQLKRAMHRPVAEVGQWLRSVVQGWFNYHAVPGNRHSLDQFRTQVARLWRHALRRRSQKSRRWRWNRMTRLIDRWLPKPQTLHPFPNQRLIVT